MKKSADGVYFNFRLDEERSCFASNKLLCLLVGSRPVASTTEPEEG